MKTKVCNKCKQEKPTSEFSNNKNKKDGKSPYCKECSSVMNKEWRSKNEDVLSEKRKIRYQENRDFLLGKQKEYQRNNRELELYRRKQWYEKNKETILEHRRDDYKNNSEYVNEKRRDYRENNREHVLAISRKSQNKRYKERRIECLEYKGCGCIDCGKEFTVETTHLFHFHHIDPSSKLYNISTMIVESMSFELIKQELDKCVLLCSKCHKQRHLDYNNGLRETL